MRTAGLLILVALGGVTSPTARGLLAPLLGPAASVSYEARRGDQDLEADTPPPVQERAGEQPRQSESLSFRSSTDLIVLHVGVKDRRGRFVQGLEQSAFSVLEDGHRQPIAVFTNEDVPATVGLIVDSSVSMWNIRQRVVDAADRFVTTLRTDDEMFALAFNEDVWPMLPPSSAFSRDPAMMRDALARGITARGRTALFDAVAAGLDYAARGHRERKILVVISDGGDNASSLSFEHIVQRTQASDVVIYSIALIDPDSHDGNPKNLRELTRASGGYSVELRNVGDMSRALDAIAADIRHVYTVGYVRVTPADGSVHRLNVVVSPPDRSRVTVRTRSGYRVLPVTMSPVTPAPVRAEGPDAASVPPDAVPPRPTQPASAGAQE